MGKPPAVNIEIREREEQTGKNTGLKPIDSHLRKQTQVKKKTNKKKQIRR